MPTQPSNEPNAEEINSVVALFTAGRYEQALPLAINITERFPLHGFGWTILGSVLMQLNRNAEALIPMKKAVALAPYNPDVHNNLGLVLRNLGRLVEAADSCRKAVQLMPDYSEAHYVLGMILRDLGALDEAEKSCRKAVSLNPESVAYKFNLANLLSVSSRGEQVEEAKSLFLDIIKFEPTHFGAWNNLGRILFETGYTSAARTAYTAAITYHPNEVTAQANLGNVLLDQGELTAAEKHFRIALELNSDLTDAHRGLASILHRLGREEESLYHRDRGFGKHPLTIIPYRGREVALQLLVLASALEGNIPWRFLIDSAVFHTTIIAVEYYDTQMPLPAHQLIFNAIGDADLCLDGLDRANRLIKGSVTPVINLPEAVMPTGRMMNAQRLGKIAGVITPRMLLISKQEIHSGQALAELLQTEIGFPVLLRSPHFHGGNYFVCVESPDALKTAAEELPGESLLAIQYLDSRSADHLFRKFRVMSINGALYPIHLAISRQWKVHYFSSDMAENEEYRKEEKVFLKDFAAYLGATVISILEKIAANLRLDYCGIDFGIDPNGYIILYEANSTMVINPPTREKLWDYKHEAINNALGATRKMFLERIAA